MTKQRTLNLFLGLPTATLMGPDSNATQKAAQGFMSGPHRWMADDAESDWARVLGIGGGPDAGHAVLLHRTEPLGARHGLRFEHVPVTAATKAEAERRQLELLREAGVDLVVERDRLFGAGLLLRRVVVEARRGRGEHGRTNADETEPDEGSLPRFHVAGA